MSLFNNVKNFVKKIVKNPIKSGIVAFLIWRILKDKTESLCESFQVIKKTKNKEIVYDMENNLYHLIKNGREIRSFRHKKNALNAMKESISEVVEPAKESEVDKKELAMGIEVEMEHTDSKEEAKKIALQHLAEVPDYYTKLKKYVETENMKISERINILHESFKEGKVVKSYTWKGKKITIEEMGQFGNPKYKYVSKINGVPQEWANLHPDTLLSRAKHLIDSGQVEESIKAQGYDKRTIDDVKKQLDKEVKDGKLSQKEADDYLEGANLKERKLVWSRSTPKITATIEDLGGSYRWFVYYKGSVLKGEPEKDLKKAEDEVKKIVQDLDKRENIQTRIENLKEGKMEDDISKKHFGGRKYDDLSPKEQDRFDQILGKYGLNERINTLHESFKEANKDFKVTEMKKDTGFGFVNKDYSKGAGGINTLRVMNGMSNIIKTESM